MYMTQFIWRKQMSFKKKDNYLKYIPIHSEKNKWDINDKGKVTIHMVHNGIYDKIAQKFFGRPEISHIDLDEMGTFIWQLIDGKNDIDDIANAVKVKFGEKAEPLYDRLVHYMKLLYNNKFIKYKKQESR